MKKQKLKLSVPRWLGCAAMAAVLATTAHAQYTIANISASGIYQGGNTVIGGIPFTNGAAFTETFSLYFDTATGNYSQSETTAAGTAIETITIGSTTYNNTQPNIGLAYSHSDTPSPDTQLIIDAGNYGPLGFGFGILENANPAGGSFGTTLNLADLSPILTTFQTAINNGNSGGVLDMNNTYIYANQQDLASTIGTVESVPEPTTLALAGLGSLSLLLFRRRK